MPVATQPTKNQLRKVKKKAAKQNKVTATTIPETVSEPKSATKLESTNEPGLATKAEPADLAEVKQDRVLDGADGIEKTDLIHVTTNKHTKMFRLFVTVATYLLGLITLLVVSAFF